jgi:hypothetical protein
MSVDDMPPDVRRFLASTVPSVPYLEAMLLLRSEPDARWSARRLASRLYVRPQQAQVLLTELCDAGLAVPVEGNRFNFTDDAVYRELTDRLAEVYARNLVAVASFIHSRTDDSARRFAEAFRLKKD